MYAHQRADSHNAGFLAAAYESGSVYIIDMRGPRILHRRSQNRNDAVISLRFAICGLNGVFYMMDEVVSDC